MILVDTDALINSLREGVRMGDALSVLTVLEYLRGIPVENRKEIKRLLEESFQIIGLDNDVILEYCRLYNSLKAEGKLISDADLLIAATAISKGMKLLTSNIRHFRRLKRHGLVLVEDDKGES